MVATKTRLHGSQEKHAPGLRPGHPFPIARKGYARADVDAFLEEIAAAVKAETPLGYQQIEQKMFAVVKNGYERGAVHRYLFALAERGVVPS